MKAASFDLNLRELSGSTGDLGILLPLALGYMTVCCLDLSVLLVALGLANIALGLSYRLPVPAEPMKVILYSRRYIQ